MSSLLDESQQEILNVMRNIGGNQERSEQSIQVIRSFLTKTKLFKSIADASDYPYILKETSLVLKYQKYKYGEFLFHQGELGDNLYFVLGGQGSVYLPKEDYELRTDLIYYQSIGQVVEQPQEKEEKNAQKSQIEQQKNQSQSRIVSGKGNQEQNPEQTSSIQNKSQKKLGQDNENNIKDNRFGILDDKEDDEVSILAMNEKHYPRYFRISRDFAMYKRVRFERYLDYFGELAAEEQFNRRLASVVASSKDQDFEVAYISLQEFKQIFSTVIESLYLIQNTLCEQLINTSKKQTINFSYFFSERIKLERGQTIFTEGTPVNGIYIVRKGTISIKKVIADQKSPIQLAILSQKDLFGHEDAFSNDSMTRTISAVSEAYGTEVQFAKIDDIHAFLLYHKEFEKELKRKSDLKINFYKKRIANIENLFKNNLKVQYQADKKLTKVTLGGEDQNAIFNKFLLNTREKFNSQDENITVKSTQNIIQVSQLLQKSNSQDLGNILKSRQLRQTQITPKQQTKQLDTESSNQNLIAEEKQVQQEQPRSKEFKGRNNLRTRSLVNISSQVQQDQNNNLTSFLFQGKSNRQEIQENPLEKYDNQAEKRFQNTTQLSKSPSSKLMRQATFSQYSSNKQLLSNNNTLEEEKPQAFIELNYLSESHQKEQQHMYQNKKISKKLMEAIGGQSINKNDNWTLDLIEKQIQINAQNLASSKQKTQKDTEQLIYDDNKLKLTYLHNDMDSFDYAKKFVILKRQHKKTQYLHQSQTNLSNLNTVEGYKKQQQAREQKAKSPISSPLSRLDDNAKRVESNEDPFFNPHISIQKFSRYLLSNQQILKSADFLPNNSDIGSKKQTTLGRLSHNELSSPIASTFTSSQNLRQVNTSQTKSNPNQVDKEIQIQIGNENENEKEKQEKPKVAAKLRNCSSTVFDRQFDHDISEDFNEELQTSLIGQENPDNQKEIINVQKIQEDNLKKEENQRESESEKKEKMSEKEQNQTDKMLNQTDQKIKFEKEQNSSDKMFNQTDYQKKKFSRRAQYQNPQQRFSQQFDEKKSVPLIQFNGLQNNNENQSRIQKDQHNENSEKRGKLISHHKAFFLNLNQSPIFKNTESPSILQKVFQEQASTKPEENQQLPSKMTESCPNRNRVLSHHEFSSQIDLENNQNLLDDKEVKYFFNPNYVKANDFYSPIIIQKLQSQKYLTNTSTLYPKHQISFVQPSTTFVERCVSSSHDSPIFIMNSSQKINKINFGNSSNNSSAQQQLNKNNQQLLSRNIKSQIGAFRNSNKFVLQQQQQSQAKASSTNHFQIQLQPFQKQQLLNQNVNSIKTNLNSLVLKQSPMNILLSDTKSNQLEGFDDIVSPIHHSSLSPNIRKKNIDRIQSSTKQGRNNSHNQISSFNQQIIDIRESFSPSSSSLKQNNANNLQNDQSMKRFSVDSFNTPKDSSKNVNIKFNSTIDQSFNSRLNTNSNTPKDHLKNKSQNKTIQRFTQQSSKIHSSNTKQLKKSLFNKEDQPKTNLLSSAFPNKNKTSNHSKQQSQENIRDECNTPPSQAVLNMKKRQNVHTTNKFNHNQYLGNNSDSPQNQLLTITPYQPFNNQISVQTQTLTKFNVYSQNQNQLNQNN